MRTPYCLSSFSKGLLHLVPIVLFLVAWASQTRANSGPGFNFGLRSCGFMYHEGALIPHSLVYHGATMQITTNRGALTNRLLEAISLKSKCQQGCTSPGGSWGEPFLVSFSFWWLQVFLGLWPHHSDLCNCSHTGPPL